MRWLIALWWRCRRARVSMCFVLVCLANGWRIDDAIQFTEAT